MNEQYRQPGQKVPEILLPSLRAYANEHGISVDQAVYETIDWEYLVPSAEIGDDDPYWYLR